MNGAGKSSSIYIFEIDHENICTWSFSIVLIRNNNMIVDHIIHDLSACPVQVINTWLPSCQFTRSMRPVFTINLLLASVLLTCVQTRTGAGGGKVGGGGGKLGSDILIPLILGPLLLTLLSMVCCWWCCRNSTRDVAGNITFRSPCWKGLGAAMDFGENCC